MSHTDNTHTFPRPLVVRMGAMGDMIMLTPLLRRLYERTGMKSDLVVCGEWNRVLFAECPWVNTIYSVTSRNAPYWFNKSKQTLVGTLKQSDASRTWFMHEHLPGLYRLMDRVGFKKAHGITTQDFPRHVGEHTCAQFSRMANASTPSLPPAPTNTDTLVTELHVNAAEIAACKQWLQDKFNIDAVRDKIVLIQAGNKKTMRTGWRKGKRDRDSNVKYWPEIKWAELIKRVVAENPNTKIILCGAPSEMDLCLDIVQACADSPHRQRILQAADDLPLKRLMALATIASACISVDTGPAHLAAAFGCPLVVLFGKTDPRQFRPLGVADVKVVATTDWTCFSGTAEEWANSTRMEDIEVDAVMDAYLQLSPQKP